MRVQLLKTVHARPTTAWLLRNMTGTDSAIPNSLAVNPRADARGSPDQFWRWEICRSRRHDWGILRSLALSTFRSRHDAPSRAAQWAKDHSASNANSIASCSCGTRPPCGAAWPPDPIVR